MVGVKFCPTNQPWTTTDDGRNIKKTTNDVDHDDGPTTTTDDG